MTETRRQVTREEIAREEIGKTDVAPGVALFLVGVFLATIVAVPLVRPLEAARCVAEGVRSSWVSPSLSFARSMPGTWNVFRGSPGGFASRVVCANRHLLREMRRYEDAQESSSWLTQEFLPRTQWVLTRGLGVGSEKVYLGRDGWLFYRPDVDYVTGPGFLGERHREARLKAVAEWEPAPQLDPVKAIEAFDRQMKARGIRLIVMPTPMKPAIHPEKLSRAFPEPGVLVQNPSFPAFVERLRASGVQVFDCSRLLVDAARATGRPQFLARDTHWRPEAMGRVAEALASEIRTCAALSPVRAAAYRREPVNVSSVGDTRALLRFPESMGPPELETVQIQQVLSPENDLWQPDRTAEVLLLGDSFSNIYALPSMGWGEAAGLAEQLSFCLQKPVDRIVENDNGAFATRERLDREIARGGARLRGTRVMVWQFAARELAFGDWRLLPAAR